MKKSINAVMVALLLTSCNMNADSPANSADSPGDTGPDTGWTSVSDYKRETVTDDTIPRIQDTAASPAGEMPVK